MVLNIIPSKGEKKEWTLTRGSQVVHLSWSEMLQVCRCIKREIKEEQRRKERQRKRLDPYVYLYIFGPFDNTSTPSKVIQNNWLRVDYSHSAFTEECVYRKRKEYLTFWDDELLKMYSKNHIRHKHWHEPTLKAILRNRADPYCYVVVRKEDVRPGWEQVTHDSFENVYRKKKADMNTKDEEYFDKHDIAIQYRLPCNWKPPSLQQLTKHP